MTAQTAQQDPNQPPVTVKGADEAKKEPPKIIEKVIDSVEDFLTKPADETENTSKPAEPKQQQQPQQSKPPTPEQAQMQGSLGGSSEYILPAGTTITLPDGTSFETHAESKLVKT